MGFRSLRSDLGAVLRARRREDFGKQQALADAVGVARETLSRIESGRSWPMPDTLDALMRILELDWSDVAEAGTAAKPVRHFDGSWRGDQRLELGRALRRGRRSEGVTLRELAGVTGLSVSQLSRIERGEGARSGALVEEPEDGFEPPEYRRVRFRDATLRRLAAAGYALQA
jgi:transcriptional regulator with XRE-family HTH domain